MISLLSFPLFMSAVETLHFFQSRWNFRLSSFSVLTSVQWKLLWLTSQVNSRLTWRNSHYQLCPFICILCLFVYFKKKLLRQKWSFCGRAADGLLVFLGSTSLPFSHMALTKMCCVDWCVLVRVFLLSTDTMTKATLIRTAFHWGWLTSSEIQSIIIITASSRQPWCRRS